MTRTAWRQRIGNLRSKSSATICSACDLAGWHRLKCPNRPGPTYLITKDVKT